MSAREPCSSETQGGPAFRNNAALLGFLLITILWEIAGKPFRQDLAYHLFANQATVMGIPNAANVLSNIPFVIVGVFGFLAAKQDTRWRILWAGLILTGFGSAYYHFRPANGTLVWDRLPMAITFAAVICIFLHDATLQKNPPLIAWLAYSVGTVIFWAVTDDLRPYIVLQFGGMIFLATVWICRRRVLRGWGWVLLGYSLAKTLEAADRSIWSATREAVSGHPWKHIAAAAGFIPLVLQRFRGSANSRTDDVAQ
jgi:hypothetical protein